MHRLPAIALIALVCTAGVAAQDLSPLREYHVWLPMTGITPAQMDDAAAAGYNAILLKVHPALAADGKSLASDPHEKWIREARARRMKLVLAILGWHGLPREQFWDTEEDGHKLPGRLDPFWPEAMQAYEHYLGQVIEHYAGDPDVVAFAPTWGIYGEAGFTSFTAGHSPHALARFNEWLASQDLPQMDRLPSKQAGPNSDWNRFVRFRYLYMQDQFDGIIKRLKARAKGRPVGTWQEMYPVIGYLWTMVRVPSADFALYESCFPFQSNHDPQRTLAEAMGFRYRCKSANEFRRYVLPLLARKRGEGQRFMGCQLSTSYAVQQYGWPQAKAEAVQFERWEDRFSPHLEKLLDEPLESPQRDVLLVFPTYAAAALTDHPRHSVDAMSVDVVLRQYGCQMTRIGSPRLDERTVDEMNAYHLIVVPASAYLMPETVERLGETTATVLFTGCFGQSYDAEYTPFGNSRRVADLAIRYAIRPPGSVEVRAEHALTRGLAEHLAASPVRLSEGEGFSFESPGDFAVTLLTCGAEPLFSAARGGRTLFLHGQFFADICFDPDRRPPANLGGSKDASANEVDLWGPYSATHPQHAFELALVGNILAHAGVHHRVLNPRPRVCAPFLGDHLEPAGVSANLAYNNTAEVQPLTVRLPYEPAGDHWQKLNNVYVSRIQVPPFSYVVLKPARTTGE